MAHSNFSRTYNPQTEDFEDIVNAALPLKLFATTFYSQTSIRLDFEPIPASTRPMAVPISPLIDPPKRRGARG